MSKISRVLILSLLVVFMAMPALATTTRVQSLANTGNYISDDSNIFQWYGQLPSYANMVMAEGGQASGAFDVDANYQALGFTKMLGDYGTLGVFMLNDNIEDMSFFMFNGLPTTEDPPQAGASVSLPTTKYAFMYGYEVEDVISVGVSWTRSDFSVETEGTTNAKKSLSFQTFGIAAMGETGDVGYYDVAFTFGTAGGEVTSGTPATTGDFWSNSSSWNLEGRYFWEWMDDVTVVGHLQFANWDYLASSVAAGTTGGSKGNLFQLGAALNHAVNTNNMLVFAAEFGNASTEASQKAAGDASETKVRIFPLFRLALESDINSWLTTRIGATKTMQKWEVTAANGDKTTQTGPDPVGGTPTSITGYPGVGDDFSWYLGAGFHVGDWDIDMAFEPDVPFRLGYWLTGYGAQDPDPPVTRISGTYRF